MIEGPYISFAGDTFYSMAADESYSPTRKIRRKFTKRRKSRASASRNSMVEFDSVMKE